MAGFSFESAEWDEQEMGPTEIENLDFDPMAAAVGMFSGPQTFNSSHGRSGKVRLLLLDYYC